MSIEQIEKDVQAQVSAAVDQLVAAAKALGELTIEQTANSVILEGAQLAMKRIGDPRLRDLVNTAIRP